MDPICFAILKNSFLDDNVAYRKEINDSVFLQRRAACDGIDALSMRDYVSRYVNEYPELMDLVAADDSSSNRAVQNNLTAAQYTPHLPLDKILSGVKSRQLFRGTIHPSGENWRMCYVILHNAESGQRSVKIIGRSFKVIKLM